MVRELFVMARQHAPSIIFMDEVDSIGGTRMDSGKGGGDSEVQRTMLELLNQLDGFEPAQNIKVLASVACCTCCLVSLLMCVALRCSGADGHEPYRYSGPCSAAPGPHRPQSRVPAPQRGGETLAACWLCALRVARAHRYRCRGPQARLQILKIHSRKMNLMRGINLKKIAAKMKDASGAEMKGVCTEAGMFALRERRIHVNQVCGSVFIQPCVLVHAPLRLASRRPVLLTPCVVLTVVSVALRVAVPTAQEDFEMACAKILKKDAEKDMSALQFWT